MLDGTLSYFIFIIFGKYISGVFLYFGIFFRISSGLNRLFMVLFLCQCQRHCLLSFLSEPLVIYRMDLLVSCDSLSFLFPFFFFFSIFKTISVPSEFLSPISSLFVFSCLFISVSCGDRLRKSD